MPEPQAYFEKKKKLKLHANCKNGVQGSLTAIATAEKKRASQSIKKNKTGELGWGWHVVTDEHSLHCAGKFPTVGVLSHLNMFALETQTSPSSFAPEMIDCLLKEVLGRTKGKVNGV